MKNRIIFAVCFLLFVSYSMFYYAKYSDIGVQSSYLEAFHKDSDKLEILNTKTELNFAKNFEILNNDTVATSQVDFKFVLLHLGEKFHEYADKYTNGVNKFESEINDIENKFISKQREIKKFNMLKFGILADIKIMNNYFMLLENKNDYIQRHNQILGFEYLSDKNAKALGDYFSQVVTEDRNEKIYADTAAKVVSQMIAFNKIYNDRKDELDRSIQILKEKIEVENQGIHSNVKIYNIIFVLALLLFILYSSILYSVYSKRLVRLRNYESILNSSSQPIMIADNDFVLAYFNKKAKEIFGKVGKKTHLFSLINVQDKEGLYNRISNAFMFDKKESYSERISYMFKDKEYFANIDVKQNEFLKNKSYVITLYDNENEVSLENEVTKLNDVIYTDNLTKAKNYLALKQDLQSGDMGLLVCFNIDNFDDFRILYKTQKTDEIIVKIYDILKQCIELYQLECKIYHTWVDEFYFTYRGKDIQGDLNKISRYFAGKNIKLLDNTIMAPFKPIFGVSSNSDAINDKLYQSQIAINEAKKYNKDIAFYDKSDKFKIEFEKKQKILRTIQYAIQNNSVIVECQPIFDTSGENLKVWTYEVLVRIKDQNGEKMSPAEFLQVAKDTSLYNILSRIVIEKTFALLQRFPENHFSVNLSAIDIVNDELRAFVIEKLEKTKNTKNLSIEILETDGAEDYERINHFVNIARQYGCKVAIDDFGNSYSNYYRILALDIDYIKIDGSIISKITTDKNAIAVVETIINLAQKQGYDIVAEYTANYEIFSTLKCLGIRYMQGFYLGKPQEPNFLL